MYAVPDIDKEETFGYSTCEAPPNPPDITTGGRWINISIWI